MSEPSYVYMFVRTDLSLPQQIIQMSHAAFDVGNKLGLNGNESTPHAVLFPVKNAEHLDRIQEFLDSHDVPHEKFWEPDISGHTAISTYPVRGEERRLFRKFKTM